MHQAAANLLMAIWKGIPSSYKSRYRRNIWQQFEDNVRSSAYTSNLGKFVDSLCLRLQVQIRGKDSIELEQILNSGNDRILLKLLREETTLLVLMVRVANEQRREEWKIKQAERKRAEAASQDPLFGLPKGKKEEKGA